MKSAGTIESSDKKEVNNIDANRDDGMKKKKKEGEGKGGEKGRVGGGKKEGGKKEDGKSRIEEGQSKIEGMVAKSRVEVES